MSLAAADKKVFVHPMAICESTDMGEGTRVWAFSHVMSGAKIGRRCNIGEHVFVEGRARMGDGCTIKNGVAIWDLVTLEDDVFIGPYVVFTNDLTPRAFLKRGSLFWSPTLLRRGVTIGANATLVCGIEVGEFAMIGAGSVVIKNVPPHGMVVGNPGRLIGTACFCGGRLDKKQFCVSCQLPLAQNSLERAIALTEEQRQLRTSMNPGT